MDQFQSSMCCWEPWQEKTTQEYLLSSSMFWQDAGYYIGGSESDRY